MIANIKTGKAGSDGYANNCLQLKVTLGYITPPIWRRIVVPDFFTLDKLHDIIQVSMGWENEHLHAFRIGKLNYTDVNATDDDMWMEDESEVLLSEVAGKVKTRFQYEYDFGDSWIHEIFVEKILPYDPRFHYPVCTEGARACPPEDCGSYPGYEDLVAAVKAKKKTEEQKELIQWAGKYDPEAFSLDKVNKLLKKIK